MFYHVNLACYHSRQIRRIVMSSFSLLLLYKREYVRRRHYVVFDKKISYLWLLCPCVHCSSLCFSCKPSSSEFYLPLLFSLPFFRFHSFTVRDKERNIHYIGAIPKHRLHRPFQVTSSSGHPMLIVHSEIFKSSTRQPVINHPPIFPHF